MKGTEGLIKRLGLLVVILFLAARLQALTFIVTNTNDTGAGSLREAINQANTNPGLDNIHFNIPGTGVHTISPATELPALSQPTFIDGYTQPGSSPNTDPVASNAVLLIEIEGSGPAGFAIGINLNGGGSTVQGLVLNRWGTGLQTGGPGTNVIRGNFFGTDPTGTIRRENISSVNMSDGGGTLFGGSAPAHRNVVGGSLECCANGGVRAGSTNVTIQGNLIGTDRTGTVAMSNGFGIISSSSGLVVGGAGPGEGNVISGNLFRGIWITQSFANTVVKGNRIGTTADGTGPLGNGDGIVVELNGSGATIGGTLPGEGNVIAFNSGRGIVLADGMNNEIRGNSMHSNGGLGIDGANNGTPNFNDPLDADTGPNGIQNFPILGAITPLMPEGTGTRIQGKFHSAPSTTFDLDFYSNPACSNFPREFLEGESYLGSSQVTTDSSGNAVIDVTLPVTTPAGARISATATDPNGNTSEFSQRILYAISPASGPSAGGTLVDATGTDFANPTGITVGAVAAGNVTFDNDHDLSFTSPALPPGTVHDVVATTPDGTTGILPKGWVSDFLDVDGSHPFYSFVTMLVSNAITAGVGGGNYGVDMPTLREQMAVFLLLAKNGLCYVPPTCTGMFADVPCSSVYARFIEALAAGGVTSGCGTGIYCPAQAVTREQMAVFLLVMLEGAGYQPPACVTPTFNDVPCSSGFAIWIEELVRRSITAGCGGGSFCPTGPVTRGQMAVFIVATFSL